MKKSGPSSGMVEGKSYPVIPDRKPILWWFLTSRRANIWDYDEDGNLTEVLETDKHDLGRAWLIVKHGSWLGRRVTGLWYKLAFRKRPCGCTYSLVTRHTVATTLRCPEHGFDAMFPDIDWEADDDV